MRKTIKVMAARTMKVMVSKYPGRCCECGKAIERGTMIKFFGRGQAAHNNCAAPNEDAADGLEPGTLANDRRMARRGISVTRFSSGAVMTQNSKGRCIDAPCCGCCS